MLFFRLFTPGQGSVVVRCMHLTTIHDVLRTFNRGRWQRVIGATACICTPILGYASTRSGYMENIPISLAVPPLFIASLLLYGRGKTNMRLTLPFLRRYRPVAVSLARRELFASRHSNSPFEHIRRISSQLTRKECNTEKPLGLLRMREDIFVKEEENLICITNPFSSLMDKETRWPSESQLGAYAWENHK